MSTVFDRYGIEHLSPSSLNEFSASQALFILRRLMKKNVGTVGAAAHRGTAVESGVAAGLKDPTASLKDCVAVAMDQFNLLTAISTDPRKEKEQDSIPGFVEQALIALRPYGVPTSTQGLCEMQVEGLETKIIGYFDFLFPNGVLVDLKTTHALPSSISNAHARQVALYASVLGPDIKPCLAYCSSKKSGLLGLQNVQEHVKALQNMALQVQRFLELSDDPVVLSRLCAPPDVDSFYFNAPEARQAAFEVFGI
jgi:hypothetical protein